LKAEILIVLFICHHLHQVREAPGEVPGAGGGWLLGEHGQQFGAVPNVGL
jgi:hypothetical protein